MQVFENGQWRKAVSKDTEDNLLLTVLLTGIIMIPLWLIWKLISIVCTLLVAFIIGNNKKSKNK